MKNSFHKQVNNDSYSVIDKKLLKSTFSERNEFGNKYDFGSVLVIGSNCFMAGAGILSATAALRSGAGLVTLACPKENYSIVSVKAPNEVMVRYFESEKDLDSLLLKKDIVVFGPGLGREGAFEKLLEKLLATDINLVVDADGLYWLAKEKEYIKEHLKAKLVLTPHAGEAARLLSADSKDISENPIESAKRISKEYSCICVLKGHNTIVCKDEEVYVSYAGNSGMATAGSGDVLSGILGGILAKDASLLNVCKAVYIHGTAGDIAAKKQGKESLIAEDIIKAIAKVFARH